LLLGTGMCLLAVACAGPIAGLYVGYDAAAYALTRRALRIMSLSSVFFGPFLVVSSFFTGIGNGLVSAIVALCGSFIAPTLMIFVVPALFGGEAIWYALPLSMLLTAAVCAICLRRAYWLKKELW
jgi:Na+-driven multidrug efflux pump